jgi:hypothetical protein
MDKLIELVPERLRSRKLALTSVLMYVLSQLQSFGIEIPAETQAYLIAGAGGLYVTVQGVQDTIEKAIKAWKGTPTEPIVDTPEG